MWKWFIVIIIKTILILKKKKYTYIFRNVYPFIPNITLNQKEL